jgi:Tfp pilus assembly protein PilF
MKSRIDTLKEYLLEDPLDTFSNYALALEYININEYTTAIEILKAILMKDENYLAAYYQLGKLYEIVSENENARIIYRKGITIAAAQKNQRTLNELKSALVAMTEDE